jgi:hypothetical protein
VLAFALISAHAGPPASNNGLLLNSELRRAIHQSISCSELVSTQSNKSLDISLTYLSASQAAFVQLERLRLRTRIDPAWAALSHEADLELTRMRTKTTSLGEAVLGNFMATQYQAIIASRIPNRSAEVGATRNAAVLACAESLRESLSRRSMEPTQECIDAKKSAADAMESENKRLDLEIEALQGELKGKP